MAQDFQRTMKQPARFAASNIARLRRMLSGYLDADAIDQIGVMLATMHMHDGSSMPIAWNDVQAAMYENLYLRNGEAPLVPVPTAASEGYNQHHHTSEYDGGLLAGVRGVHNHKDNQNGGFAFAVFHPGTAVPQADWE